jgi:Glycosyltransferase family 87
MEPVAASSDRRWLERADAIPLILMVILWAGALALAPSQSRRGDVLRFYQIAHGGTPYSEQEVEYPPLETALVLVLGSTSQTGTVWLVALTNAIATIWCWRVLRRSWSPEVGRLFLWFALPLQIFMPFRVDTVSVLLAVWGIAIAQRDREAAGGGLLGGAVLFKLWPIVLVPVFVIRKRRTALVTTIAVTVGGALVWAGAFGLGAVRQVETYRGATGWQIESVFGAVYRYLTHAPIRIEAGAARVGETTGVEVFGLRLASLLLVALAWIAASRRSVDPAGGPALASVASVLLLSPVASPQYVMWLLPWAAITASERRSVDVRVFAVGAAVTASAVFAIYWGDNEQVTALIVLAIARAFCIAMLAVIGFTHRSLDREAGSLPTVAAVPSA